MLAVVTIALGLIAGIAWAVAVLSALHIVSLAPAGRRLATLFDIGWWRFDRVSLATSAASEAPARRYVAAFIAFFAAVMLLAIAAILAATPAGAAQPLPQMTTPASQSPSAMRVG